MKKKPIIFIIIIIIIVITFIDSPALAAESTQSASPSSSLQKKLQALQEEIASKAAQLKTEVGKKLQNKAFTGFIKAKSETSLTLASSKSTKIINLNDFTQYAGVLKTKVNFKSLAVDDYIAALGDIDEAQVLTAKKIIRLEPPEDNKQIVFGQVISVSNKSVKIQTKEGKNLILSLNSKTTIKRGQEEVNLTEEEAGKSIVAVGTTAKEETLKTRLIYLFPSNPLKTPAKSNLTPEANH